MLATLSQIVDQKGDHADYLQNVLEFVYGGGYVYDFDLSQILPNSKRLMIDQNSCVTYQGNECSVDEVHIYQYHEYYLVLHIKHEGNELEVHDLGGIAKSQLANLTEKEEENEENEENEEEEEEESDEDIRVIIVTWLDQFVEIYGPDRVFNCEAILHDHKVDHLSSVIDLFKNTYADQPAKGKKLLGRFISSKW